MSLISQLKGIETHFTCPIENVPLTEAVAVMPCIDRIQQTAAERLLGKPASGDWRIAPGLKCPVCKKDALGYLQDEKTSQFSQALFNISPLRPPQATPRVEDRPVYPGNPSIFVHTQGDWEVFGPIKHLCRRVFFDSMNENALIKKFQLLGYIQGDVRLFIEFDSSKTDAFIHFLNEANVKLNWSYEKKKEGRYRTENKRELRSLFKVLTDYNNFHTDKLEKMRKIVEVGEIPVMQAPNSGPQNLESVLSELLSDLAGAQSQREVTTYPGVSGHFILDKDLESLNGDLSRKMCFKSTTPNSLITALKVQRSNQGKISLGIDFQQDKIVVLTKYFMSQGVNLQLSPTEFRSGSYSTDVIEQVRAVFKLFCANNTLPEDSIKKIEAILA